MRKPTHVLRAVLLGMMMFAIIGQLANAQDEDVDAVLFQRLKDQGKLNAILNDLNLQGKTLKGIRFMGEVEEMSWDFGEPDVIRGDKPIVVQKLSAINCTEFEDTAHLEVTKRRSASHTWHIEGGLSVTLGWSSTQSAEVEIPGVGKVGASTTFSMSGTASLSSGGSWTEEEFVQWNQGRDITVAPRRKARADFVAYEKTVDANFTARVRCMGATEALLSDPNRKAVLFAGWHRTDPQQSLEAGESLPSVSVGDGVSSVYVDGNVAVECYKNRNYNNLMGIIDRTAFLVKDKEGWVNLGPGNQGDDPDYHFDESVRGIENDKIRSVRVIDKTLPRACIYASTNYGGDPICYMAGEEANLTDYRKKVHSIKLFNAKITLYDARNLQTNDYFKEYTNSVRDVGSTYAQAFQSLKVESAVDVTNSGTSFNIQDYLSAEDRTFTISGRYEGITLAEGKFQTKPSLNLSYADCGCAQLAGDSSDCDLASWCAEFPGDSVCRPFEVTVKADFQTPAFDGQIAALGAQIATLERELKKSSGPSRRAINAQVQGLQVEKTKLQAQKTSFLDSLTSLYATLLSKNGEACVTNGKPRCKVSFNPIGYTLHELQANPQISAGTAECIFAGWETQRGRELWGKAEPRPGDEVLAVYECGEN